ncbi:MAG: DUF4174 domain-containing protein [Tateyamaria sp.]|uniref:DUF4174 domain-containing protein n=1 Tax=Tateyamaria sp. TaxID=1929288 RepID=UPI003268EB8F
MKQILPIVLAGLLGGSLAAAQGNDDAASPIFIEGEVDDLSQFVWENRLVVIFADSPNDPNFGLQIEYLEARIDELVERDILVLTDTDPSLQTALRTKLRPRGFMMVLIGKDGEVKLRKPFPWDVRELTRTIDKMPIRQREIHERRTLQDN